MQGLIPFVLLISFALCEITEPGELKAAVLIIRHGARAARANVSELASRVSWPNGKDELTPSGQRQLHLLGHMMRKYLVEQQRLVSAAYNESEILVRAGASNRTVMSAHSFMLGMYPDLLARLSAEQLREESTWLPPVNLTFDPRVKSSLNDSALPHNIPVVPIKTNDDKFDRLLSFASCSRFYMYRMSFYASARFQKAFQNYNATFQHACELLQIHCAGLAPRKVWEYVDAVLTAEFDGQLSDLSVYPELVESLERFYTEMEYGELTSDPKMINIAMNDFAKVVPGYLAEVIDDPATPHKLTVLSTHESTMLAYLLGLKVKKELYPTVPYGSNILLELRKLSDAQDGDVAGYYVNMSYNSKPIGAPKPFADFKLELEETGKLTEKWADVCALPKEKGAGYLVASLSVVFAVLLAGFIAFGIRRASEGARLPEGLAQMKTV